MTLRHAGALKKIHGVLSLRQKKAVRRTRDGDAEEVVEVAEVGHGKLGREFSHDVLKQGRR
jgi:hypothetical protein